MQEEKSWVYTLILGVCMLLCLLLIGRMLLGHPGENSPAQTEPETDGQEDIQMGIEVGEQELSAMIAQALPFQTGELALHIGADQTVSISATVRKKDMENSGLIPGSLRTALLFLPDHCMVYGTWLVELQGGSVILQCQEAKIADITLTDEITNLLSEQLGAAINHILQQQKISPDSLQWEDGILTILP